MKTKFKTYNQITFNLEGNKKRISFSD